MAYSKQLKFESEMLKKYEDDEKLYCACIGDRNYYGTGYVLMYFDHTPYLRDSIYCTTTMAEPDLSNYTLFAAEPKLETIEEFGGKKNVKLLDFGDNHYIQKKFADYFNSGKTFKIKFYVPKDYSAIVIFNDEHKFPVGYIAQFRRNQK